MSTPTQRAGRRGRHRPGRRGRRRPGTTAPLGALGAVRRRRRRGAAARPGDLAQRRPLRALQRRAGQRWRCTSRPAGWRVAGRLSTGWSPAPVTSAFVIAMIPLVSLVFEVVRRGIERFDIAFFTNSMSGVVGEGGGAYHAIVGTLIITGLAALISVPIGLMTAIYLVEYGTGQAEAGDHLPGRRHDRDPVDRRGSVRLRPLRRVLRTGRPPGDRRRGGAVGAHDPGGRPLERGDPQARAQRAARGQPGARGAPVADHRQGRPADRCRRPRAPASPWPSPGSSARPLPCS